jgi:hypothetical protein
VIAILYYLSNEKQYIIDLIVGDRIFNMPTMDICTSNLIEQDFRLDVGDVFATNRLYSNQSLLEVIKITRQE